MPIYEYRCAECNLKSSFFTRSINSAVDAICKHCGGDDMRRVISMVSFRMSSSGSSGSDYYADSSNIGRHAEDTFKKFGVDMPDSVRKTIDDARKGKMPDGLDI